MVDINVKLVIFTYGRLRNSPDRCVVGCIPGKGFKIIGVFRGVAGGKKKGCNGEYEKQSTVFFCIAKKLTMYIEAHGGLGLVKTDYLFY